MAFLIEHRTTSDGERQNESLPKCGEISHACAYFCWLFYITWDVEWDEGRNYSSNSRSAFLFQYPAFISALFVNASEMSVSIWITGGR